MTFAFDRLPNLVIAYGFSFIGAVIAAIIGWWLAALVERMSRRALLAARTDSTVAGFLASLARYSVVAIVGVVVLQLLGVQATSLIAVLGAASLAIGLALQGTLSNMAAGVMLLLFRPFRSGDLIEVAGKSGTVKELNLFRTELADANNVQVLIPNGQVWGTVLTNFSAYPTRRVSASFTIGLDEDVEGIAASVRAFLQQDTRILPEPGPSVTFSNLADKTVELSVSVSCASSEAGALRADLIERMRMILRPEPAEAARQPALST